MARDRNGRAQSDNIRKLVIFSAIIGILVLVGAIASGIRLSPDMQVKTNPSDQPSVSTAPQGDGNSRETTGGSATSGDNPGASGNAGRLGSGPPGSGTGSPGGSSSNVTGSTPSQGGSQSDAPGSATR